MTSLAKNYEFKTSLAKNYQFMTSLAKNYQSSQSTVVNQVSDAWKARPRICWKPRCMLYLVLPLIYNPLTTFNQTLILINAKLEKGGVSHKVVKGKRFSWKISLFSHYEVTSLNPKLRTKSLCVFILGLLTT